MQADVIYLFGLIAVYLTLLVSSAIAPDDYLKRGLSIIPATIITLVFMCLVYILAPYGTYVRNYQIVTLGNEFRSFASQMGQFGQFWQNSGSNCGISWAGSLGGGTWQFNTNNINISDAGRREITNKKLLEVNAGAPGTFYIRGYSMGDFDGSSWDRDPLSSYNTFTVGDASSYARTADELARFLPASIAEFYTHTNPETAISLVDMMIRRTGDFTANINYQPYYGSPDIGIEGDALGHIESFYNVINVHSLVSRLEEQGFVLGVNYGGHLYNSAMHETYTTIDESTARRLRELAIEAGINPNAERYIVADAVARYIMSSGTYTLEPGQIPRNADFTLYFLEELNEGYCIHFATAAVLMLRSLDIPARFTSGYVATVSPAQTGTFIDLTDQNAHAWVEVFYDDIGWLYLEVTPSGGNTYVPRPRPHSPASNISPTPEPTPPPVQTPPPNLATPTPEVSAPGENNTNTPGTGSGPGGQNFLRLPPWLFNILVIVILITLIVAAFPIRRKIITDNRRKRFNQSNTNEAVIYIWKYIKKLGRKEIVPPNDIEELALKARFSQHTITAEERKAMASYANRLAYEIYNGKGDYSRLWLKYIRALC